MTTTRWLPIVLGTLLVNSETARDKLKKDGTAERAGKKIDKTVDDLTK